MMNAASKVTIGGFLGALGRKQEALNLAGDDEDWTEESWAAFSATLTRCETGLCTHFECIGA